MSVARPSAEYRKPVRELIKSGEWEHAGATQSHGVLRHVASGQTLRFSCHGRIAPQEVRLFCKEADTIMGRPFLVASPKSKPRTKSKPQRRPVDEPDQVEEMWDRRARLIDKLEANTTALKVGPLRAGIAETERTLIAMGERVEPYAGRRTA